MTRLLVLLLAISLPLRETRGVDFVDDIQPILSKQCYSCHGPAKQKSGLRLDAKASAFKGGELYGPAIVAGDPLASPLMRLVGGVDESRMPPDGDRLSDNEIQLLTQWIESGALWPASADSVVIDNRLDHWSFKPIQVQDLPAVVDAGWPRQPIDHFVLSRLESERLRPAREAKRREFIRRVNFDLIGLPPTRQEVESFEQDERVDAYERLVDRLLSSPRFGERWGQHWLDVVRYADTHGFEVNTERPNAWPYRDYVIEAINQDTPYDAFVREQIVGDAMGKDAATGFLVTASVLLPGQIGADEPSKRLARQDSLDEIVNNIGQTFLGLSVGCARCHDHKFDPIPQRDYYAMQAYVAGVEYEERDLKTTEAEQRRREALANQSVLKDLEWKIAKLVPKGKSGATRVPINSRVNYERFDPTIAKRLRLTILETNRLEPCLDEIEIYNVEGVNVARATAGAKVMASGSKESAGQHELRFVHDGEYGNARSWMGSEAGQGWVEIEFAKPESIDIVLWGRDRLSEFGDRLATNYRIEVASDVGEWNVVCDSTDRAAFDEAKAKTIAFPTLPDSDAIEKLANKRTKLEESIRAAITSQRVFAGVFRTPDTIRLLTRGDPEQPKEVTPPCELSIFSSASLPGETSEQDRRRALAESIVRRDNPLTARVMVNRIWQGHFGVGIVETPSDFGRMGARPSHPVLLDWLANELVRSDWSAKAMHRMIVLSATYRQSTEFDPSAAVIDAESRLLWRFPRRRLEGEAIRDAMLSVSGILNLEMGGSGFDLFDKRGGLSGFQPVESFPIKGYKRMVYAHKVRRERDAVFGAFDCPDAGQSAARRRESTTPIQALNLFNSRFSLDLADAFAKRIEGEAPSLEEQITLAYRLALSRAPEDSERDWATPVAREHGLATLCRALLNSNEFLFLP